MSQRPHCLLFALVVAIGFVGCDSAKTGPSIPVTKEPAADGNKSGDSTDSASDGSATTKTSDSATPEPGEKLLEPFDPPSLAELDAKAEWEDQLVLDSLELLRERQKGETPLATVEEALKLKNTSPENNAKILSAMGRLPEDDSKIDYNATMVRHLPTDVKSTNPILISSVAEFDVAGMTSFGLFSIDWTMRPFAAKDSVVSWQSSKDRMYDKIVMRDDLTWSDGEPITAHDLVFSFQTIMNPKVPVPAVRSGTDKLRWVHAYDDHTLVFFHKEALATNVWNINFPVLPKHIYEKSVQDDPTLQNSQYHVDLENAPVVGGSFVLKKRDREQEMVFERRESWYMHKGKQVRDKPFFKEVRFKIINDPTTSVLAAKKGQLDDLPIQIPEIWVSQTSDDDFYANNTKVTAEEWTYFYFGWNLASPFFNDIRVRKAMSYAVDYRELLDKLCYGLFPQSTGMFHPNAWMAPKTPLKPYVQDLDKAEALLDEAGWIDHDDDGIRDKELNGKLTPFKFSMIVRQDPLRIRMCELLKFNLEQIGIECNITPLESTVLQERMLKKNFQASFGGWGTGADPESSVNVWGTGEGRNFVSYSNAEVDKLYAQGIKEFDRAKRAEIYGRIGELIYEDQPVTFLYYMNAFYGFNKELRGYTFSARGPYHFGPGFGSIYKAVD